jgi:hypothetical protein
VNESSRIPDCYTAEQQFLAKQPDEAGLLISAGLKAVSGR